MPTTADVVINALRGLEHSGSKASFYRASFAVPNRLKFKTQGNNSSGLSFGVSQLDIGSNAQAQSAYAELLGEALRRKDISQTQYNSLLRFSGVKRPDLKKGFSGKEIASAQATLDQLFTKQYARQIIDKYDRLYIADSLLPKVNSFLATINAKWNDPNRPGPETVFDPAHPDYATALAAIISIANRTGNLNGATDHFEANKPDKLTKVEARYNVTPGLGDHWASVLVAAEIIKGTCFVAGTHITMWGGHKKPIEAIVIGDKVTSFDLEDNPVPGVVSAVFRSTVETVIGFFGTAVTPGHVVLAGGEYGCPDRWMRFIDVIRNDGLLVRADGTRVRAATGAVEGSEFDQHITVREQAFQGCTSQERHLRLGSLAQTSKGIWRPIKELVDGGILRSMADTILTDGEPVSEVYDWPSHIPIPTPDDAVRALLHAGMFTQYHYDIELYVPSQRTLKLDDYFEFVKSGIEVYNFSVDTWENYVANGVRVHNTSLAEFLLDGDRVYDADNGENGQTYRLIDAAGNDVILRGVKGADGNTVAVERLEMFLTGSSGSALLTYRWSQFDANGNPAGDPDIDLSFPESIISGEQIGQILGSTLGRFVSDDPFVSISSATLLGAIGANLGEAVQAYFSQITLRGAVDPVTFREALDVALDDFPIDLGGAAIGSISSFLVGELFSLIGVDGVVGDVLQQTVNTTISVIARNILRFGTTNPATGELFKWSDGLNGAAFGSAIGSLVGSFAASKVFEFESVGGQLGASLGSSVGAIAATAVIGTSFLGSSAVATFAAGFLTAGVGAFIGFALGGLIGSVFGGTPRSGAEVSWNDLDGVFEAGNAWSRKGGSKQVALSMATSAAEVYNGVVGATGGVLINAAAVQAGRFGMRGSQFVYWANRSNSKYDISFRSADVGAVVNHGAYLGLNTMQIGGGNAYAKRAFYASLAQSNPNSFSSETVLGDILLATDYELYLDQASTINSLIATSPNSVFAAGWVATLARIAELGVDRRHAADWFGGHTFWLDGLDGKIDGIQFSASLVVREYGLRGERVIRLYDPVADEYALIDDTLNILSVDVIQGTSESDYISLTGQTFSGLSPDPLNGITINGQASAEHYKIGIAASVATGDGDDVIEASDLGDDVSGDGGNDTLYGGRLDDWLLGGDGNDILDAGTVDQAALGGDGNYLDGGAGNDTLKGREGSDWLEGGDGTDTITGGAGDDILAGGAGDGDSLKGGTGADQYLVRLGDGLDNAEEDASGAPVSTGTGDAISQRMAAIALWRANPNAVGAIRPDWVGAAAGVEQGAINGGEDAVVFGQGIGIGDVRLQRSGTNATPGNDLIIQVMQTVNGVETFSGTQLTIRDWFTNPFKRVEWLKFTDGNEVRIGDITSFIVGGSGNDVLIGTNGNDFVYGGAGDDALHLLLGDDIGNGGTGNDLVRGGGGGDLLIGGLGNDELVGGAGRDALSGDDGADEVYGGADNDILSGGRGDGDVLVGGAGDDTFKYARGDGHDIIFDEYAGQWAVVWTAAGQWNTAAGFSYVGGEVRGPNGAVLRRNVGTEAEPVYKWFGSLDFDEATQTLKVLLQPQTGSVAANAGIDTIELAPGINIQDVILQLSADGKDLILAMSDEDEDLSATSRVRDSITLKDWFVAPRNIERLAFYQTGVLDITAAGTNLVAGTDGNDGTMTTPLKGTSVVDWITGAAGDDVIAGGAGNDILAGNSGFDTLKGEDGDDVLYGGTGNDTLDGGGGRDILIGGSGQDIASYESSSANLHAFLSASWANSGHAAGDEYTSVEDLTGGSGLDVLGGDLGENELVGGGGFDTLMGNGGDDTYVWNTGDGADTITEGVFTVQEAVTAAGALAAGYSVSIWQPTGGRSGSNFLWRLQITGPGGEIVYDNSTYSFPKSSGVAQPVPSALVQAGWRGGFARTNGQQVTRQFFDTSANGGNDDLEFGPNISLNDLTFIRSGNDLTIRFGTSTATQVTIRNQALANSAIENLKFHDGLSLSLASLLVATSGAQLLGTSGDDLIAGQAGALADNLSGGAGNDVLVGYAGNDILLGGDGDDILEGGAGADRLDGGAHVVVAGQQVVGDTARYVRSTAAVSVDLNLAGAQGGATGADSVGDVLIGIENVTGSNFNDTITGNGADNRLFGLSGNDIIRGGGGNDVLTGDDGVDQLFGDAGEDNIAGGLGNDVIRGGSENDLLDGGEGNDQLFGEAGNDSLTGGFGTDTLDGGDGDDILSGDEDADTLTGGAGNDILVGGMGNDTLNGETGDDRFLFDRNSGTDVLTDTSGVNSVQFEAGVAFSDIWLTRVGNDLRIAVIGGNAAITVTGFYAPSNTSRIRAIQTTTHAIFLDHPEVRALITSMTAATATPAVTPPSMPASISSQLATFWHEGGKAAPRGPVVPRQLTLAEDGSLTVDGAYGVIDHDNNVTAYTIKTGAGPSKGTISGLNAATGALTYIPFADANGTDSFIVIATDADGQSVELPVNLTITAINDAPRNIAVQGSGTLAVLESAPGSTTSNGTIIGQFTALDVEGDTVSYSLANNAGGRFAISASGELRVLNATLLDRELAAAHTISVTATDSLSASTTAQFTVTVSNVNEAPNAPVLGTARGIAGEFVSGVNATNIGTNVAQFTLTDPDGAPSPSLIFVPTTGNPGGRFQIVGNQVQFAIEADFEALVGAGFAVTDSDSDGLGEVTLTGAVQANDGSLSSATSTAFSVRVEDVNQQHTAINVSGLVASIDERDRLAAGATRPVVVLGTLSVTDPDLSSQLTGQHNWTVFEGAATVASTRFAVNASNQLVLLANQSLDFETQGASISLKVRATDKSASPLSLERTFTFVVVNKDDIVDGTAIADTLTGQANRDILRGFGGNDTLNGLAGDDQLEGGDGDDLLNGGDGLDTLLGGIGNDTLNGDAGNDTLSGGDGDDILRGGAGNDTLNGDLGNDGVRAAGVDSWRGFTAAGLIGGDGNDILNGGDGDDYLEGGLGADQLNGGNGFDGVTYANSAAAVTVNLLTNTAVGGDAQGDTLTGIELVQGSSLGDTITGSAAGNVIYGGAGNDTIRGGAGADFLFGGDGDDWIDAESGNDFLDGGNGNDILRGGSDNDTYFIGRNAGNDRIQNFDTTGTNFDHITFAGSVLYADIWLDRVDDAGAVNASGNHLRMTILGAAGTEGSVTVDNWFTIPERTLPENYFKIDLISDGDVRAALPVNVDALVGLMASIPAGNRPVTQAQMASLRSGNQAFANAMEEHWGRLSAPRISDTVSLAGVEALDNGTQVVSFAVRAWFQDDQGLGVVIPASSIDLALTADGGHVLSNYVTAVDYGTPDASGNRTVTLTLAPNASTHLLPGGTLPLQLQARIRGTTRTTLDAGGIALTITPTADNASFSQLASTGGNAGTDIALNIMAGSVDVDGSERVDVLVRNVPPGYSLVNGSGTAVGTWDATNSWWRLTTAQLSGLKLRVPSGRFEDAALQVAAQSIDGSSTRTTAWNALNIVVNAAPTNITLSGSVAENAASGTFVGTLSGIDPDTAEGVAAPAMFQLLNDAGGRYRLESAGSNRLIVNNGGNALFDFEAANRDALHTITVRVTDATGLFYDRIIVVGVTNVNETPNVPNNGAEMWSFFDETGLGASPATAGGLVATVPVSDPDGTTPTLVFSRFDGFSGFDIVGNQIRFNSTANLNFEWFRDNGYGVYDWNNDGRLDAHISNIWLRATDGSSPPSGEGLVKVFITDVNERPNNLVIEAANLFSEVLAGDASHAGQLIARFTMADPDGPTPNLVILSGNDHNWFTTSGGNHLAFAGANFTADWLRATLGQYGQDAGFYYDSDGDGLKEIRVATLTLAARDASGALSDSFTYNVLIEDKNEAPVWTSVPDLRVREDRRYGFDDIGAVRAGDPDSPQNELIYVFSGGRLFYDPGLNMHLSASPDEKFMIHTWTGQVLAGPGADFDFDNRNNPKSFSYQIQVMDRWGGTHSRSTTATVQLSIDDLPEAHSITNGVFSIDETLNPLTGLVSIDLKPRVNFYDPEDGVGIKWRFSNGTDRSGIWHITEQGFISVFGGSIDYEALTTRTETTVVWDDYYGEWIETTRPVRDHSLATQVLAIEAWDRDHVRTASVTASIIDKDEGPRLGWAHHFIVRDDQGDGLLGQLRGYDPETGALASSYSINITQRNEKHHSRVSSSDIDNTGNPTVWVDSSSGLLYFDTPGDGEWEGGIRSHPTLGGRWAYQLDYLVEVTMQDALGETFTETFTITFLKHGTSGILPIMLDLDGDGIELVDFETSTVTFDMDRDGIADRTGWVSADDGMLVLDRNGNGIIDDSREISFASDDENAITDLEGLRAWDTNHDGILDSGDDDFARFQIWRDLNQDGISGVGELFSLKELGISGINLTLNLTGDELVEDRNVLYATSEFFRTDGTTGIVGDVSLAFDPSKPDPAEVEPEPVGASTGSSLSDYSIAAPIVFDFDGDSSALVSLEASTTLFDMNGDGIADETGWIAVGDAFLALDRNSNGLIDDISEISFVEDLEGAETDLEGLIAFDTNGDAVLDAQDERFVEFRLWFDGNANGVTDAGELLSLAEAGVVSISLTGTPTGETLEEGRNIVFNTATYQLASGEQGTLLDAGLAFNPLSALPEIEFQRTTREGRARNWRVSASNGSARIIPREANGLLSTDAGRVAGASLISFGNFELGLLSTIIIDLDGDGIEARSRGKTRASFDMNGDGVADDTGWVAGGDGMLVIDRDGDGMISHVSEIAFLSEGDEVRNSWEGLSELDNTNDNRIDASDARFGELLVWVDRNGDGISQSDELRTLAEVGITQINLRNVATTDTVKAGRNIAASTATFEWDSGLTGTIGDVFLAFEASSPPVAEPTPVPTEPDNPDPEVEFEERPFEGGRRTPLQNLLHHNRADIGPGDPGYEELFRPSAAADASDAIGVRDSSKAPGSDAGQGASLVTPLELGEELSALLNPGIETAPIHILQLAGERSAQIAAARMADQLVEAMSTFGIDGTHEVLRKVDSHGTMAHDLFASAAA